MKQNNAQLAQKNRNFTYAEVRAGISRQREQNKRSIAILPVGCVEQHGPFLPIQTDSIIAEGLSLSLVSRLEHAGFFARSFPPIHYTPTQTNASYPGTVSVEADIFAKYCEAICLPLLAQFDAIILINGHGPAEFRLKEIAFSLVNRQFNSSPTNVKPVFVVSAYDADKDLGKMLNVTPGRHADWREFLLLYHLMGENYFPDDILQKMKDFQSGNDFSIKGSAVMGIPMEYRSVDGVQGNPLPFPLSSLAQTAETAWTFIEDALSRKIGSALTEFDINLESIRKSTGANNEQFTL